jgi:hypothetical protein
LRDCTNISVEILVVTFTILPFLLPCISLSVAVRARLDWAPANGFLMKFFAVFPGNVHMLVEIIEVRDHSSEAFVNTSRFKNHSEREVKPQVGWKLTSRAPRTGYDYP